MVPLSVDKKFQFSGWLPADHIRIIHLSLYPKVLVSICTVMLGANFSLDPVLCCSPFSPPQIRALSLSFWMTNNCQKSLHKITAPQSTPKKRETIRFTRHLTQLADEWLAWSNSLLQRHLKFCIKQTFRSPSARNCSASAHHGLFHSQ